MRRKQTFIGLTLGLGLALGAGCESSQFASQQRIHTITNDGPAFTLVDEQADQDQPRAALGAGDALGGALFDRYMASLDQPQDASGPRTALAPLRLRDLVINWVHTES